MNNREEKKWEENETRQSFRDLWDNSKRPHLCYQAPRKRSECDTEKMFEEILAKKSKFGKRHTNSRSSKIPKKDELKEILTQIHQNQTAENYRQQKHLETAKGKNDT